MSEPTAERLAQRVQALHLVDHQDLSNLLHEVGRNNCTVEEFSRQLVRRELLTNWQLERVLKGETHGYFYGPCKVLYMVGTGTFSRVFRAQNTDTGEIVAVKVLRRRFSDNAQSTDQFAKEGEMGRRLRHPNIVPIYDVYSKGLTHYLTMEFVEGRNLREFVKTRKKIDPLEATRIAFDITAGLAYASANGVHHRDLKMTNVLISSKGQPKLVDFGLASFAERADDEANPRTIDYAGLERATGVKKDDDRSDIFFMGCIYYNLACGKPPLPETRDRSARLSKGRYMNVPHILSVDPDIPAGVVSIIARAMEPNADRRYQTPQEMMMDMKQLIHRLQLASDRPAAAAVLNAQAEAQRALANPGLPSARPLPGVQKAVMVVEGNAESQDAFRTGLKRSGYRVLLTTDPARAITRFDDNSKVADCIIFSTADLGSQCFEAFNSFVTNEFTRHVPAILLLGAHQADWKEKASLGPHHLLVQMPVKFKDIRVALARLLPSERSGFSHGTDTDSSTMEAP